MSTETVTVNLGQGRRVSVRAELTYRGTEAGNASLGNPNVEQYTVTIRGIECTGTWDGDARHNTYVRRCPPALVELLMPLCRSQQAARERRELAAAEEAERKFYGRKIS